MILFHGTDKVFNTFCNKASNYREQLQLPRYNTFTGEMDEWTPGGGTCIVNPGGLYFTDEYWSASAYMNKGDGYNLRILMVQADVKRLRICTKEEYLELAREWMGEPYHTWRMFDRIAWELQKREGCDMVRMVGMYDYAPIGATSHGECFYDQYITHNPNILRIVGEYLHDYGTVEVAA